VASRASLKPGKDGVGHSSWTHPLASDGPASSSPGLRAFNTRDIDGACRMHSAVDWPMVMEGHRHGTRPSVVLDGSGSSSIRVSSHALRADAGRSAGGGGPSGVRDLAGAQGRDGPTRVRVFEDGLSGMEIAPASRRMRHLLAGRVTATSDITRERVDAIVNASEASLLAAAGWIGASLRRRGLRSSPVQPAPDDISVRLPPRGCLTRGAAPRASHPHGGTGLWRHAGQRPFSSRCYGDRSAGAGAGLRVLAFPASPRCLSAIRAPNAAVASAALADTSASGACASPLVFYSRGLAVRGASALLAGYPSREWDGRSSLWWAGAALTGRAWSSRGGRRGDIGSCWATREGFVAGVRLGPVGLGHVGASLA